MTGAGGVGGGFAPFMVRVPQAEDLIELVLQGLSPEKALDKAVEQDFPEFVGGPVADNTVELFLGTPDQMGIDWLYTEVQKRAPGLEVQVKAPAEGKLYIRSEAPGALQKLIKELRGSGLTFQVSEVRTETRP